MVGARSLKWTHRRDSDRDYYFLCTTETSCIDANLSFRASGRPSLWNPLTGAVEAVSVFRKDGNYTIVPLQLPAGASRFLAFERAEEDTKHFVALSHDNIPLLDANDATRVDRGEVLPTTGVAPGEKRTPREPWVPPAGEMLDAETLIAWSPGAYRLVTPDGATQDVHATEPYRVVVDGEWRITFPPGWDAPEQVELPQLTAWSELNDPFARSFSGTAVYTSSFELPALPKAYRVSLDLGRVDCLAEVEVNGRKAGVAWVGPYELDLTDHVVLGANSLVIRVTNTWHNRLLYDAGLPRAERKTWAIHAPDADQELVPAGLTGPVVLRVGEVRKVRSPRLPK